MATMRSTRLPAALLLASLSSGLTCAQAATLVQLDGATAVFFYDADYWGAGAATVSGDSISFAVRPDFDLSVTVRPGTTTASQQAQAFDVATPGVVAVAKGGYRLRSSVGTALTGTYSMAELGSQVDGLVSGSILLGSIKNGAFVTEAPLIGYSTNIALTSTGIQQAGTSTELMYAGNVLPYVKTLGVETYLTSYVRQVGSGTTSLALDTVEYRFSTIAIPEPSTYAMLVGGLAVLGALTRRRGA